MEAELDMNSNHIVNLPDALSNSSPLTLGQASAIKSISQTMSKELIKPYLGDITAAATSGIIVTNSDAANNVTEDTALVFDADSLPTAVGANITTATEVVVSDNLSQSVLTPISSILALAAAAAPSRAYFRKLITRWKNVTHIYLGEGECTDDTGAVKITHTNDTFEKSITSVWAEGSGSDKGCRATSLGGSAPANNETYFVFIISKTDGTTDFVMDTSETGAHVLSGGSSPAGLGYVYKRCVGIVCTNGSGQVIQYTQTGNDFIYSDLPQQHVVEGDNVTAAVTQDVDLVGMPQTSSALTTIQQHVYGYGASRTLEEAWLHVRPNGETQTSELTHKAYFYAKGGDYGTAQTDQFATRRLASATGQVAVYRKHDLGGDNNTNQAYAKTWIVVDSFTFDRRET
jgi:hypothetical protein